MASGDDNRLIIVAYSWIDHPPWFRVRTRTGSSERVPALGFTVRYRVDEPPRWHCPGRVPFRSGSAEYHDCFKKPQGDGRTCVDCAVAEATLAGSLHHAHNRTADELDADVEAHLHQPNLLYLAAFADGSVKIGTSAAGRIPRRLLEQGAWRARLVADAADGVAVRVVEDLVTEKLGVPQSVSSRRKLNGLISPMADDRLERHLDQLTADVHRLIEDASPAAITATASPWENPARHTVTGRRLFEYPADLRRGAHQFTVRSMIGRLAIIERDDRAVDEDRFILDLGPLFGLELESGRFDPVELMVQDSLF